MSFPNGAFIAVEGVIGAGKTSLAKILAQEFNAELVLEERETNPFLEEFYRDKAKFALQTQLIFLLNRHRQQSELKQSHLFQQTIVSDYLFDKDRLFATVNLNEAEFDIYSRVAQRMARDIATPDFVIYLAAPPKRLLTNIRIRDIEYERDISEEYLSDLCEAYRRFFAVWDRSPLMVVDARKIDFVNNAEHRRKLIDAIIAKPTGKSFFDMEA